MDTANYLSMESSSRDRRPLFNINSTFLSLARTATGPTRVSCRLMSNLTHVDDDGKARMVDVSDKQPTLRSATAEGSVYVGPEVAALIRENSLKKGDVFTVAQLAGVIGAKKTSDLIPLCHNVPLSNVNVTLTLNEEASVVKIICRAKCYGKTGVEMEALTGVSVAALTVYDMCKAVTHDMVLKDIRLLEKTGGKRGVYLVDDFDDV